MTTIIVISVVVLLVLLWIKAKTASKKPVDQRGSFETILVSLFVMGKKNVDETANSIRTPEISKEEALQKTNEAIRELKADYETQVRKLIETKSKISEVILPKAKTAPGKLTGRAQTSKKKMEQALADGKPQVAEKYKQNAVKFLAMKKNATERIEKCEKILNEIETSIDLSQAEYEMRLITLQDIVLELETTVTGSISAAKFQSNIGIINSLRQETADKLRQQNAAIEASQIVSGDEDISGGSLNINESDFLDELNSL